MGNSFQYVHYDDINVIHFFFFFFCNSQRLRPAIHEIITSKIKAHAELVNSSRSGISQGERNATPGLHFIKEQLESFQFPKQKHQNGISLAGTLSAVSPVSPVMAPTGRAQAATRELLDSILDTVVRIFGEITTFLSFTLLLMLNLTFSVLLVQRIMSSLERFWNQNPLIKLK